MPFSLLSGLIAAPMAPLMRMNSRCNVVWNENRTNVDAIWNGKTYSKPWGWMTAFYESNERTVHRLFCMDSGVAGEVHSTEDEGRISFSWLLNTSFAGERSLTVTTEEGDVVSGADSSGGAEGAVLAMNDVLYYFAHARTQSLYSIPRLCALRFLEYSPTAATADQLVNQIFILHQLISYGQATTWSSGTDTLIYAAGPGSVTVSVAFNADNRYAIDVVTDVASNEPQTDAMVHYDGIYQSYEVASRDVLTVPGFSCKTFTSGSESVCYKLASRGHYSWTPQSTVLGISFDLITDQPHFLLPSSLWMQTTRIQGEPRIHLVTSGLGPLFTLNSDTLTGIVTEQNQSCPSGSALLLAKYSVAENTLTLQGSPIRYTCAPEIQGTATEGATQVKWEDQYGQGSRAYVMLDQDNAVFFHPDQPEPVSRDGMRIMARECIQCAGGNSRDDMQEDLCPAGTYSLGLVGVCWPCDEGYISSPGSMFCTTCPYGTHASLSHDSCEEDTERSPLPVYPVAPVNYHCYTTIINEQSIQVVWKGRGFMPYQSYFSKSDYLQDTIIDMFCTDSGVVGHYVDDDEGNPCIEYTWLLNQSITGWRSLDGNSGGGYATSVVIGSTLLYYSRYDNGLPIVVALEFLPYSAGMTADQLVRELFRHDVYGSSGLFSQVIGSYGIYPSGAESVTVVFIGDNGTGTTIGVDAVVTAHGSRAETDVVVLLQSDIPSGLSINREAITVRGFACRAFFGGSQPPLCYRLENGHYYTWTPGGATMGSAVFEDLSSAQSFSLPNTLWLHDAGDIRLLVTFGMSAPIAFSESTFYGIETRPSDACPDDGLFLVTYPINTGGLGTESAVHSIGCANSQEFNPFYDYHLQPEAVAVRWMGPWADNYTLLVVANVTSMEYYKLGRAPPTCLQAEYVDGMRCQTCPEGYGCDGVTKTLCSPGTFSRAGMAECSVCATDYVATSQGSGGCKRCPDGQTASPNHIECVTRTGNEPVDVPAFGRVNSKCYPVWNSNHSNIDVMWRGQRHTQPWQLSEAFPSSSYERIDENFVMRLVCTESGAIGAYIRDKGDPLYTLDYMWLENLTLSGHLALAAKGTSSGEEVDMDTMTYYPHGLLAVMGSTLFFFAFGTALGPIPYQVLPNLAAVSFAEYRDGAQASDLVTWLFRDYSIFGMPYETIWGEFYSIIYVTGRDSVTVSLYGQETTHQRISSVDAPITVHGSVATRNAIVSVPSYSSVMAGGDSQRHTTTPEFSCVASVGATGVLCYKLQSGGAYTWRERESQLFDYQLTPIDQLPSFRLPQTLWLHQTSRSPYENVTVVSLTGASQNPAFVFGENLLYGVERRDHPDCSDGGLFLVTYSISGSALVQTGITPLLTCAAAQQTVVEGATQSLAPTFIKYVWSQEGDITLFVASNATDGVYYRHTVCVPGQYREDSECATCPPGFGCDGEVKTKCTPGTIAARGGQPVTEGATQCDACPRGSWCNGTTAFQCELGQYTSAGGVAVERGATECSECPAGHRCDGVVVVACEAGTYAAKNGQPAESGATACALCHEGTYSTRESTKCTGCAPGFTSDVGASDCIVCPVNFTCPGGVPAEPCSIVLGAGAAKCEACVGKSAWFMGHCTSCDALPGGYKCQPLNGIYISVPKEAPSAASAHTRVFWWLLLAIALVL